MESLMAFDLPLLFAAVTAFCVSVYVLADGFDLGVGILLLAAPRDENRDVMMASIEPVWDGNETWLVMGGTLLFTAFPAAYHVLLPAFHLPIMFMLFALIFRGIAFGFRLQAVSYRRVWDIAFAGGSVLATVCQGFVVGGPISGVPMEGGMFSGGPFSCFTILGLLCGLGLLGGYALLGAGWLIWKAEGATQIFAREVAHAALILAAGMMAVVSGWTALADPDVESRWFAWPNIAYLAPLPAAAAIIAYFIWRSLWGKRETLPFILSLVFFLLGFAGLMVSLWPYIVPKHISIWDGAADHKALVFASVGIATIIPIVLAYQALAYWVFRGQVEHSGYGEH